MITVKNSLVHNCSENGCILQDLWKLLNFTPSLSNLLRFAATPTGLSLRCNFCSRKTLVEILFHLTIAATSNFAFTALVFILSTSTIQLIRSVRTVFHAVTHPSGTDAQSWPPR